MSVVTVSFLLACLIVSQAVTFYLLYWAWVGRNALQWLAIEIANQTGVIKEVQAAAKKREARLIRLSTKRRQPK